MRRGKATSSRAARWERRARHGLFLAGGSAVLWVLHAQPPLGVPGQHLYPYHPARLWSGALKLLLLALPLAAVWSVLLLRRGPLKRAQELALVIALSAGSLMLHAGTATVSKLFPGAELCWPFLWVNTEGAYLRHLRDADEGWSFLSNYVHRLDVSPIPKTPHWEQIHHPQVHPPGLPLAFVALESFYSTLPALGRTADGYVLSMFDTTRALPVEILDLQIRHARAVAMSAAMLTVVMASLAALICYAMLRPVWPAEMALAAAGLMALVPGTHLFSPSVDQAYPALTLVLCCGVLRLATTRRWPWGVLTGLIVYVLLFIHIGFAVAVLIVGTTALLAWKSENPGHSAREAWQAYRGPVAWCALGFLTPAFLLQAWVGYPTFRVIRACLRNNALFNAAVGRTYWPWVAVAPLEFLLSLGVALGLVAGGAWLMGVVHVACRRSLRGQSPVLMATVTVLLALDLLGMNRGETARLWLFLTPLVVLGAVDWARRRCREPRGFLLWLAAAQLVQIVVLRVILDPNRTSSFFWDMLRKG